MSLAQPGRALIAAVVAIDIALLSAGCNSGPVDSPHRSGSPFPFEVSRIVLELNQAWTPTGPGQGAYGDLYSFEAEPSLYQTSWHLRLASAIGTSIASLSPAEVTAWVDRDMSQPGGAGGMRRLESIYLEIGALRALGRPIPGDALDAIDRLRGGEVYAWDEGAKPSWSATSLAVDAMSDAGAAPRGGLQGLALAALTDATAASDFNGWTEQLLPVWSIADRVLPDSTRAPFRPALSAALTRLRDAIAPQSLNEMTVFLASQETTIAIANHLPEVAVPVSRLSRLMTPLGYLTTADSDPTPSMVNTYEAMAMGYAGPGSSARHALATYLNWTAAPKGWREDFTPPSPVASFYDWEVSQALGETGPRQPLTAQVKAWLSNPPGSSLDLYFLALLAQRLGVEMPEPLRQTIRGELESNGAGIQPGDLVVLARLSHLLAITAGPAVTDLWRDQVANLEVGSSRQLETAFTLALALGDKTVVANLQSRAAAAGSGSLWGSRPGAPAPDLMSTAIAATILGRTPDIAGAVQTTFGDRRGYWLYAPRYTTGNVVDPRTLYLGLWLTGAPVDPGGVV